MPRWPYNPDLDTGWMEDAACTETPELPWIGSRYRVPKLVRRRMEHICAGCPVLAQCDAFVDQAEITSGYWAGLSRNKVAVQDYGHRRGPSGGDAA